MRISTNTDRQHYVSKDERTHHVQLELNALYLDSIAEQELNLYLSEVCEIGSSRERTRRRVERGSDGERIARTINGNGHNVTVGFARKNEQLERKADLRLLDLKREWRIVLLWHSIGAPILIEYLA